MLDAYKKLGSVTKVLDDHLASTYPTFFGKDAKHPTYRLKPFKVVHDNLWGTNRFSWLEMAVIDTPLFQRLRYIHQTGLAFLVYPTAHHTRFEHSLGVTTIASRTFDALLQRHLAEFQEIAQAVFPSREVTSVYAQLRDELRLAAILHDIGHSLHSHTSETVYKRLPMLKEASEELTDFAGQEKGAGEVLSFCISQTIALRSLIARAAKKVVPEIKEPNLDLMNVSLLIIGRSRHPLLQFMADIISSEVDADKLDYLRRDSEFAGLPLRYDLERFLYTVKLAKNLLQTVRIS
jgi:uncharacterized protein